MKLPPELEGRLTITVIEAARLLGVSKNQAYAAAKSGALPTMKLGHRILVPVAPLLKMLGIEE